MSSSPPTQYFETLTLTSHFSEHTLILTLARFFSFATSISYTNSEHFQLQGHIHFLALVFSVYVAALQSGHTTFSGFLLFTFFGHLCLAEQLIKTTLVSVCMYVCWVITLLVVTIYYQSYCGHLVL